MRSTHLTLTIPSRSVRRASVASLSLIGTLIGTLLFTGGCDDGDKASVKRSSEIGPTSTTGGGEHAIGDLANPTNDAAKPQAGKTDAEKTVDATTGFIVDSGWEMVAANCIACHSSTLVTQNRGDRARWEKTIRWMQETQGLWPLAPPVEDAILTYLSKNYGPDAAVRRRPIDPALMPPTPEALAKADVEAAGERILNVDPRTVLAQAALKPFQQSLMATLKAGMEKGAANAVDSCHFNAPKIANDAQQPNIEIGRTTLKLRNQKNAPADWIKPTLDDMAKRDPATLTPRTIILDDGALAHIVPIRTMPLCLQCHGENIAKDVDDKIRAHHPDDKARGYKEGEFRGVFYAKVNAAK